MEIESKESKITLRELDELQSFLYAPNRHGLLDLRDCVKIILDENLGNLCQQYLSTGKNVLLYFASTADSNQKQAFIESIQRRIVDTLQKENILPTNVELDLETKFFEILSLDNKTSALQLH